MNNTQRKFHFFKLLREAKGRKINEFYYENPEGQSFSDFETWTNAVTAKYPAAQIKDEWDTNVAIEGGEAVGFWDNQTQNGIVYNLNLVKKENVDNTTFQTDKFSTEEAESIKNLIPGANINDAGLITFDNFALIKFKSGVIDLVQKTGTEYADYKTFANFEDMTKNLKSSLPAAKPVIESTSFNIDGFKENMDLYVNDIESFITYDEAQSTYFVTIPFTALKTKISLANTPATTSNAEVAAKIVAISQKYPRCLSANIENNEIHLIFSNKSLLKESLYCQLILEYAAKDEMRIRDIIKKSGGDDYKASRLAQNMAKSITDMYKAFDRGSAASDILGKDHEVTKIFMIRAKELGYPVAAELAKTATTPKAVPGSKLPKEQQYKNPRKDQRVGSRRFMGNPILPCGSLNLRTGDNKYFNVKTNGEGTIEVWKTSGGSDKAWTVGANGQLNDGAIYKAVITSGTKPLHEIGEHASFIHDQNHRDLFSGEMVDYISTQSCEELINLYGKSMSCYVYK
jgi:hypothetical protein